MGVPKSPSVQRLEFFTDGVLAIIMTIMAIELKIPELGEHLAGDWNFGFLVPELPKLLSYALGFFMIATGWVSHLLMARSLERTNVQLIAANLVYLFLISLLPAATAFVGDHPTLPKAVFLWGAVASTGIIWGDQVMVRAAESAGLARLEWGRRRNFWASMLALLAVAASLVSVRLPGVLIFLALALHWVPMRHAIRLFETSAGAMPPVEVDANAPARSKIRPAETKTSARPKARRKSH